MTERYREITACDNCGSTATRIFGTNPDPDAVHRVQRRCDACGLVFASPRLTSDALAALYADEELFHGGDADAAEEDEKRARAGDLFDLLVPHAPRGTVLDVGAGTGAFLDAAADRGFQVAGVEPSAAGIAFAREHYGVEGIVHATLETAGLPEGGFTAAIAWHVLEHVSDLDGFVRELARVLEPGGVVLVGTESYGYPSLAAIRAAQRLRGRKPRTVTHTVHTFVFSPSALRDSLERRGFETVELRAYDELSLRQRLAFSGASSGPKRIALRGAIAALRVVDRVARRGPYLLGVFRKTA